MTSAWPASNGTRVTGGQGPGGYMLELLLGGAIVLFGGWLLIAWTRGPSDTGARRLLKWAKYLVITAIGLFVLAYIVLAILFTAYSD